MPVFIDVVVKQTAGRHLSSEYKEDWLIDMPGCTVILNLEKNILERKCCETAVNVEPECRLPAVVD